MTKVEKRVWTNFIKDNLDLWVLTEGIKISSHFFEMLRLALIEYHPNTIDRHSKLEYVIWIYDCEYKKASAKIYGMKNLDATNPKI